ncbi:hypothetical protein HDV00_012108 [Rhizophlyctis rosea]|nr:hypothetical protein HDV00_012108 [Rhizophlyctis rosea]
MHVIKTCILALVSSVSLAAAAPAPEDWAALAGQSNSYPDWYPEKYGLAGISNNGFCGWQNGNTGCPIGTSSGTYCCSSQGYCGNGAHTAEDPWCGDGCQAGFGRCHTYPTDK